MKYPEVAVFDALLPRLGEFDAIIDVRSEAEFALDHLPGAINCPVLNDAQRIQVGTLYKQSSAFDAKKLGAPIIARNIAHHIDTLWHDKPRDWRPLVYCWRGGNRSGAMALIMARIGWPVAQLEGGYKNYRAWVSAALAEPPAIDFRVVCGPTGSGKSRLLQTLDGIGAQVLDLEQLAAHRGSVLGHLPNEAQPSQKMFESLVLDKLRGFDVSQPVFVEAESKKVGNLRVPEAVMARMRGAPCIDLQLARPQRVQLLMEDYEHFCAAPSVLADQLTHLTLVHGRAKIQAWQSLARGGALPLLVDELLVQHYDPAYLRSIERNFMQYPQAHIVALADISQDDFLAAARALLAAHTP